MMSFSISYPDLIKVLTLQTSLEEGIEGEKRPRDKVKTSLRKTLVFS
jgi:hypothetical protein